MDAPEDDAGPSDTGDGPWLPATVNLTLSEHGGVSPSLPSTFAGREGLFAATTMRSYGANDDEGHCMSGLFIRPGGGDPLGTYEISIGGSAEATFSFGSGCRQNVEFTAYEVDHRWLASEGTLEITSMDPLIFTISNARMEPDTTLSQPVEGSFVVNGGGEILPIQL